MTQLILDTSTMKFFTTYQKIEVATSHGNEVYTVWDIDDEDEQIEKLLSIIQLKGSKQ
jgi:hypothetical protein